MTGWDQPSYSSTGDLVTSCRYRQIDQRDGGELGETCGFHYKDISFQLTLGGENFKTGVKSIAKDVLRHDYVLRCRGGREGSPMARVNNQKT